MGDAERRADLLIEFLHLIQDEYGHLSAAHLRALAEELKLSQAEVFEVATFYAHFDVVKEDETPPPALTIRVCDSLSCELAGAEQLQQALEDGLDPSQVRVLRAPCMGRCDTAPVLEIGHKHIDHATPEKVNAVIAAGDFHAEIPNYETLDAYVAQGGYETLKSLRMAVIGKRCRTKFYLQVCVVWAARVSHRVKKWGLCAPMQGHGIWP